MYSKLGVDTLCLDVCDYGISIDYSSTKLSFFDNSSKQNECSNYRRIKSNIRHRYKMADFFTWYPGGVFDRFSQYFGYFSV